MKKVVLFGGGRIAKRILAKKIYSIVAVIDNYKHGLFSEGIPFIKLDEYAVHYAQYEVVITTLICLRDFKEQLQTHGIIRYSIAAEAYRDSNVIEDSDIKHGSWPTYLSEMYNHEGMEVLEVGSRIQTGACFRELFDKASYTGFDYYGGENVDVVGDAHCLSSYFDKQFDLIFSSAVFEHLALPWIVSVEMIKMLKVGGHVFVETHYSYSSHERPWHFFQFSENALNVLFPEIMGIKCVKKGCFNLLKNAEFSEYASEYLQGQPVTGLYCHSEFLGQKFEEVDNSKLDWTKVSLDDAVGATRYPKHDYVP